MFFMAALFTQMEIFWTRYVYFYTHFPQIQPYLVFMETLGSLPEFKIKLCDFNNFNNDFKSQIYLNGQRFDPSLRQVKMIKNGHLYICQ